MNNGTALHRRTGPIAEVTAACDSIEGMTVINTKPGTTRFRRSGGAWIASVLALVFVTPFAGAVFIEIDSNLKWVLAPIAIGALIVPAAFSVWSLRSGVDAGADGIRVKALLGSRHIPWTDITGFDRHDGKVYAALTSGSRIELPSIRPVDIPQLVTAGGNELVTAEDQ